MRAHDDVAAGEATVRGTPSGHAQGDPGTDAADPATSAKHREHRIGSAGGGPYPIGSDPSDNEGARR
ncbi:hypothetical protein [Actinoplanes sp. M2I2]|uniref:hypothetical protein n=1 Tax=Actinoplanes sp. M2I2 TaxID=1734444 RepID=UPI002020B9B8|nr:hypothetical protein [Actinoplanes sp. M2I2]